MSMTSERTMHADDVLFWPDGYWCFGAEIRRQSPHDDNHHVIRQHGDDGILFWPDGYWCLGAEIDREFLRDR
jgi:hypothetical protein